MADSNHPKLFPKDTPVSPFDTSPDQPTPDPEDTLLAGAEQLLSLPRHPAPEGFAARVLTRLDAQAAARVQTQPAARSLPHPALHARSRTRSRWSARALAPARLLRLALVAVFCLTVVAFQYHREQQGRIAARQFEFALRLTSQHLQAASEHAANTTHFIDRREP